MFEKRYDLKGLKLWYSAAIASLAISILAGVFSGIKTATNPYSEPSALNYIIGIVSIGLAIAMVVGIYMLRAYSEYFVKAFKHTIMSFAFALVGAILSIVGSFSMLGSAFTGQNISGFDILLLIIGIGLLIAGIVFSIMAAREQIMGMQDVALQNDNHVLAQQFAKIWKMYWIALLIIFGFFILYFIWIVSSDGAYGRSYGYGNLGLLLITSLGLLGGSIFIIVIYVLWILRAKALYDLYNGALISPAGSGESMGTGYGTPVNAPQTDSFGRVEPMHYGTYGSHASMAPQQSADPAPVVEPVVETVAEAPVVEPVVEPIAEAPVVEPVVEPIAEAPVAEPVVEPIADEPAVEPLAEAPADEPVLDPYAETPVDTKEE